MLVKIVLMVNLLVFWYWNYILTQRIKRLCADQEKQAERVRKLENLSIFVIH